MDKNTHKPIQTENTTINLLLFIIVILLIGLLYFLFKCYNELAIISDLLQDNMLFK